MSRAQIFEIHLFSLLSPSHRTPPKLPLTTINLTDLDTVLTVPPWPLSRVSVCLPLKNSGCTGCAWVSSSAWLGPPGLPDDFEICHPEQEAISLFRKTALGLN